jgi:hypothetical protein
MLVTYTVAGAVLTCEGVTAIYRRSTGSAGRNPCGRTWSSHRRAVDP